VGEAWEGRVRSGAPPLAGVVHGRRRLERRRRWRESLSRARIRLEEEQHGGGRHQRVAPDPVPRRPPESSMGTVDVDPHRLRPPRVRLHLASCRRISALLAPPRSSMAGRCELWRAALQPMRASRRADGERVAVGTPARRRQEGRGGNWLGFGGERGCGRVGVRVTGGGVRKTVWGHLQRTAPSLLCVEI
jgi:hypothetical protein